MRTSVIILSAPELGAAIASACDASGLTSITAGDEYDALRRIRTEGPELFLVDVEAPGATEALRVIADESLAVTVLALTPADDAGATLRALDDGAHSCASRSCGPAELHARIKALRRRPPQSHTTGSRVIQIGDITIDPAARSVWRAGDPLMLAATPFEILLTLAKERGGVVSHARLIDACRWGRVRKPGLRAVIAELRRLTGLRIRAVPRVGYALPTD